MPAADWQWSWILADEAGRPLPGAHIARGRRLVAQRSLELEARLTLSLHDTAAIRLFETLRNGIPQLRVYLHIPPETDARLVFSGLLAGMSGADQADGESHVNLIFRDAFSVLRHRFTATSVSYTAQDAGQIARQLIDATHTAHGDTTIATDPAWVTATKTRDRAYESKQVAEAIGELTEVQDPIDWWAVYLDPRENAGKTMQFHAGPPRGSDVPGAKFEFGEGTLFNCKAYGFTGGLPVNRVRGIGAQDPATGLPLVAERLDQPSIDRFRTYMQIVSATDVSEQATLDDKARGALRPGVGLVTQFTGDPALCPLPIRDFNLGDTVRWNVDDGAMQEQTSPRVQTIEVGLDDSDNIDDLVIGVDPEASGAYLAPANTTRRYQMQQRDLMRRLAGIERRVGL